MTRRRVTVTVDEGLKDRLDLIGQVLGVALQQLCEEALDQHAARTLADDEFLDQARSMVSRQAAALGGMGG